MELNLFTVMLFGYFKADEFFLRKKAWYDNAYHIMPKHTTCFMHHKTIDMLICSLCFSGVNRRHRQCLIIRKQSQSTLSTS